jgi:hypothetical protein
MAAAVLALATLATGIAAAAATLPSLAGRAEARARILRLREELSPASLRSLDGKAVGALAGELLEAAALAGRDPARLLAALLPRGGAASALLATEADLADFREGAATGGRAGASYAAMLERARELEPLRADYEALLAVAWARLASGSPPGSPTAPPSITRPGEALIPSLSGLDEAHPRALDVFFRKVERRGKAERGPELRSLSPGIVLAAADDWRGGAGLSAYRGGGISPKSGNGLIVYEPRTRRFYSYFHLSELSLRAGDIVEAGDRIGWGGDSGANARKPGHGGHVHLEIFDAAAGRALGAREIRAILAGG